MSRDRAVLRGQGLEVWRGERCVFERLDFELEPGGLALVTGPNGSGKTTLLRVLAGFMPPTAGRATWTGTDTRSLSSEQRAEVAYCGHLDGLKRELSVLENLEFHQALRGGCAMLGPLLAELSLEAAAQTQVRHLSAGQRRRAALVMLRSSRARLWLLDEPATNLDAEGGALVVEWTRRHCEAGGLAVVATHQPEKLAASGAFLIELA